MFDSVNKILLLLLLLFLVDNKHCEEEWQLSKYKIQLEQTFNSWSRNGQSKSIREWWNIGSIHEKSKAVEKKQCTIKINN